MDRILAHVDMDCFFVACEEKKDPSLKGKPVMVGATGKRGVVSAANYEARKFGVFSATPISIARKRCPNGIFLPGDYSYYREQSQTIMSILHRFSDDMQQVSVDEAYLDITSFSRRYETLEQTARILRSLVVFQTNLSCSVGIAKSKTLAKIGSELNKPAGTAVLVNPEQILQPLPIETFPGVGKKSKQYFHNKGVLTIGDLMKMNRFRVLRYFGMYGVRLQQIALGEITSRIRQRGAAKSVSRERTFFEDVTSKEAQKFLGKVCKKVYKDLGRRACKTISIKVRYHDFSTITRDYTLQTATTELEDIKKVTNELFITHVKEKPVRLVGVKLSKLTPDPGRQSVIQEFMQHSHLQRSESVLA